MKKARTRTKEIERNLQAIPSIETSSQHWDAFRGVCSTMREGLNDIWIRGNRKRSGIKCPQFDIIPDVTKMHRHFAAKITQVST